MKISLCLMTFNELPGCMNDLPNIPLNEFNEVYAIDGGSTDGTIEYLEGMGISVYMQPAPSLNYAYIYANQIAKHEAVVVFFPKGTINPLSLLKFKPFFLQGYELIIASRKIEGASNEEDIYLFRPRKWASMGLSILLSRIWQSNGNKISDPLHGFKGWKKDIFSKFEISPNGISIDLETTINAYRNNLRIIEFPVKESVRLHGETHFKFWSTGRKLLKTLIKEMNRESKISLFKKILIVPLKPPRI